MSLTSFPARINNVWQVVECMLNQTLLPRKIYLWLSREQFPTEDMIPDSLRRLEDSIFQINIVAGDIRSHKKYYYVASNHPEDYVFMIDDDIYYPTTILEKSWKAHLEHPDAVICNYGYHIAYNDNGSLKPYNQWRECYQESDKEDLFFGSGGGTLIKPSLMNITLTDIDRALELAPIADDVWLNAMVRLSGLKIHMIRHGQFLPIVIKGDERLTAFNRGNSQNDIQIHNVEKYFGNIFSINQ